MDFNKTKVLLLLALGDSLYGALGLFSRHFADLGFDSFEISFLRTAVIIVVVLPIMLILDRDELKVGIRGLLLFLSFSIFKLGSDVLFFYAINTTTMSMATMLQMTFPYYVLILSFILFKEAITAKKLIAMALAFIGCTLITGGIFVEGDAASEGIVAALVSGLAIGIYVLGGTISYRKGYKPAAYMLYCAIFGNLLILPFVDLALVGETVIDINQIGYVLGLGVLVSLIPLYLEAWSAKYILPTTISVVGLLEIVSASIIGMLVFDEVLGLKDVAGIALVIFSIFLINVGIFRGFRRYVQTHPEVLERMRLERERLYTFDKRKRDP